MTRTAKPVTAKPVTAKPVTADTPAASDRDLTIVRCFDAPRVLVFDLWIRPDHIRRWWGPRGYTTLSSEADLRLGGAWRVRSRHVDGAETEEHGVFREILAPERLVFTHAWAGPAADRPDRETLVTVTFAERGGKTEMTFHQTPFATTENRDGHRLGWSESFDMLAEHLADG